jgi:hypothetical protein
MRRLFLAILVGALSGGLSAQETDANAVRENFSYYSLDFSVPESPAFALLGVTPQDVIYPTSLRHLSASLVSGITSGGDIQQGIALEAAPYLLVAGNDITLSTYRSSWLTRRLVNTQVSVATAKVEDDPTGKGTKAALGLHMKLYDLGDPRLDEQLAKCYHGASDAVFNATPINPFDPADKRDKQVAERQKMLETPFANCRKAARERLWNRSSWLVGLAGTWTNQGNVSDNLRSESAALWTTFAYGFEEIPALKPYAQVLLHARVQDNEVVESKTAASGFVRRDSSLLGTRLRLGSESASFLVEASYNWGRLDNGEKEDLRRVAVGGEIKVSKDIWLVGSIGGEGGFKDGSRNSFVLGGLKFGSASEPQFGTKR